MMAIPKMRYSPQRALAAARRCDARSAFRRELDRGHAVACNAVANALYNNAAVNGNVAALVDEGSHALERDGRS